MAAALLRGAGAWLGRRRQVPSRAPGSPEPAAATLRLPNTTTAGKAGRRLMAADPGQPEGNKHSSVSFSSFFQRAAALFRATCAPTPSAVPQQHWPMASGGLSPVSPSHLPENQAKERWDRAEGHVPRATRPLWDSFYRAIQCGQCLGESREMLDLCLESPLTQG